MKAVLEFNLIKGVIVNSAIPIGDDLIIKNHILLNILNELRTKSRIQSIVKHIEKLDASNKHHSVNTESVFDIKLDESDKQRLKRDYVESYYLVMFNTINIARGYEAVIYSKALEQAGKVGAIGGKAFIEN